MSAKSTSGAFMTSVIIHVAIGVIAGAYLVTQTQQFKDLVSAQVLQPKEPPRPKVRKPVVKQVVKPSIPTENTVVVEQVQVQPRVTTAAVVRTTAFQPQTVLAFSNKVVKLNAPINPNVPKVVNLNAPVPQVITHAALPVSDAPDALAFSGPVATAPSAGPANMGRGIAGGVVQVKLAFARPPGLKMVEHVGAVRDALGDVVENIRLGHVEVPPLPRGEPGGRVIGKGRDIRGVFRFTRIRHSISDWWADASSLLELNKWLNAKTEIKSDMNIEGGAIKFTDANLMKSPLVFMTGHNPSMVRWRHLMARKMSGGKLDNKLSEADAAALRRYLVEKGGFLIFDDCGVDGAAQTMFRLFQAQMRHVIPEHIIERIPNDHEIYSNFYEMGGPPVGFDIFWEGATSVHGATSGRNFLEGYSVGENLSVLVVRRDYMCAMESVSLPTRSVHYSPGVYRFLTNVVVYALTHGNISDYSRYIPADTLATQNLPTKAPEASKVGAVE